jgi:ATP-dependent Clp protease adaptor protein ClpS
MIAYQEDTHTHSVQEEDIAVLTDLSPTSQLIVWNDDVNTFEWVITTLMEVCGHTHEQAEQCAYLIHFKGKYAVKKGELDQLKPMCHAILDRGINATIEAFAA